MKFSDLVVLGSTMIEFSPECYLVDGCGCLIGMAFTAKTGISGSAQPEMLMEAFPWMFDHQPRLVKCPVCNTPGTSYAFPISCLACHVKAGQWNFEQAIEYIRSIEPPDVPEEADAPDTIVPVWNRYLGVRA